MVEQKEKRLYVLLLLLLILLGVVGILVDGLKTTLYDFFTIQTIGARLIQDFTFTGIGGAFFNAALVGLIGLAVVYFSEVSLAGPTVAAIFTLVAFGFFGKTPINILPIIAGVAISARIARKSLGSYSLIALFGTALGPLVTYIMFETSLGAPLSLVIGLFLGILAGMALPAIAGLMLQMHQGYNLYNIGFTCGFLGLFLSSALRAAEEMKPIVVIWNSDFSLSTALFIPVLSLILILFGLLFYKKSSKQTITDLITIQKLTGRLPTDFFDAVESGAPLVNMGLLGLGSALLVYLADAPFNGPVLGGILTVMGFGAFGKSLKNCWPIVAGVFIATMTFGKSMNAPGPILALLFSTTLAPIAGEFGIITGIIAGFIHLFMVESTAAWHGGLDLYNNGFAGGLTASLVTALLYWYKTNRPKEDFSV